MVHAGVREDGDALRRRAKVRLLWLVAAHAALATLPAVCELLPQGVLSFGGGRIYYLVSGSLEGLLLAQLTLLALWAGLSRGPVVWRLVTAALACVYLATWPTIGPIISPMRVVTGTSVRRGGAVMAHRGIALWEDVPRTLFQSAGAIAIFVALFAAGFFVVRRWLNELEWRLEGQCAPRGGALQYVLFSALAVTASIALFFIVRYRMHYGFDLVDWGRGVPEYACMAFPVSTICVVWATLGAGRARWRVLLAFVLAASMAFSIWIGDLWDRYDALRYYGALDWRGILRWILFSLLPVAILAATLLAVRACGYRLVRRTATRRQFTLRELLAALTLACAGLALVVPAERQRDAVAAIKAAGGRVEYAETGEALWEFWPAYFLRDWLPRDYFDGVIRVSLDEQEAADELLAHLPALKDLEELSLWGNHITGAGLIHLRGLRRLRYLDLDGNPISDAGLAHLRGVVHLEELSLCSAEITDAGLAHLPGLAHLEELSLCSAEITDAGLAHLPGLAHLEELSLCSAEITDAGLAHLKELPNLHLLALNCPAVTDEGLAHLQGLTILEGLSLENTRVTDAGLRRLEGLTSLLLRANSIGVSTVRSNPPKMHPLAAEELQFETGEPAPGGFNFWNLSYGWPLSWRQYVTVSWGGTVVGETYSAGRLAANLAIWLVLLAAPAGACEWLLRHYCPLWRYRPRLRFSLRTLLIATGLAGSLSGWFAAAYHRASTQDPLIAAVNGRGGSVWGERWGPKWLDRYGADRFCRRVFGAEFNAQHLVFPNNTQEFQYLFDEVSRASDLQYLSLKADQLTPENITAIANLRRLETLQIETEGLAPGAGRALADALGGMQRLRILSISGSDRLLNETASEWLPGLGRLSRLEHLRLRNWTVASEDLAPLTGLTKLETLTLERVNVDQNLPEWDVPLLARLPALAQLEALDLTGSQVDDRDLPHIARLSRQCL